MLTSISARKLCCCLALLGVITTQSVWALDAKQAATLAEQAAKEQNLPAALAKRAIDETVRALLSLPTWSPFYPGARVSAIGSNWQSDADEKTASGGLSFLTNDARDKVASYYAKAFAAHGTVTEIRDENPWTVEVVSSDGTETMTLNLENDPDEGLTSATLHYNKAPISP